ncbi:MAG TPA: DUF6346 domain-containing protein [Actinoplanes sp.]|jgi:hypothetical protein
MAQQDGGTSRIRSKRLAALRGGLVFLLGAAVLWAVVSTAGSIYGGTGGSTAAGRQERDVTAVVQSCRRQGPIGGNGLGYWWSCRAVVGATSIDLRHSVATPADVGRSVRVHELCTGDNHTQCGYGRPVAYAWGLLVRLLDLVEDILLPVLLFLACFQLYGAVFGERAYDAVRHRLTKGSGRAPPG